MNALLDLATDALATYRLVRLATRDGITEPLRAKAIDVLFDRADITEHDATLMEPAHERVAAAQDRQFDVPKLAELIVCPWCSGMWIAFGVVAARTLAPRVWRPVGRALALSAAAGLIAGGEDR